MTLSSSSKLFQLKKHYASGLLSKSEFIATACEHHQCLWDYAGCLTSCDIHGIEITAAGVVFELGDEHIKLIAPSNEARVAPLEVLNFDAYEPVESQVMNLLAAGSATILDVGSNIGYHSIRLAVREATARIYAFEPVPLFYDFLARNVALNNVGSRVQCLNYGFSNENGSFDFFFAPRNGTNVSLRNVAGRADAERIKCLTMKMDDWLTNNSIVPDFIKIDVEGAELLVLQGAYDAINSYKPKILAELLRKWSAPFGYHPNDALEYMRRLGYECWALSACGINLTENITDNTEETNFAFLHSLCHRDIIQALQAEDFVCERS